MKRRIKGPLKVLLAVIAMILFCVITMLLWNALMPVIFGLPAVNFIQAAGLLILFRLLFGHGRFGRHHWRGHYYMREKWANMSPEERKKFYESRCWGYNEHKEKTYAPETGKAENTAANI